MRLGAYVHPGTRGTQQLSDIRRIFFKCKNVWSFTRREEERAQCEAEECAQRDEETERKEAIEAGGRSAAVDPDIVQVPACLSRGARRSPRREKKKRAQREGKERAQRNKRTVMMGAIEVAGRSAVGRGRLI